MPTEFKVEIRGLAELEQRLRDESKKVAIKTLRSAGREAGKIFQQAIEARAPRDTGFLSEHLKIATRAKSGDEGSLRVEVGPSRAVYPKRGQERTSKGASEVAMMREFGTRFQPATPFMRPAFEESKEQVLDVFVTELRSNLEDLREK